VDYLFRHGLSSDRERLCRKEISLAFESGARKWSRSDVVAGFLLIPLLIDSREAITQIPPSALPGSLSPPVHTP
jgi:hypothetical protein